jgi:hypothetical protein
MADTLLLGLREGPRAPIAIGRARPVPGVVDNVTNPSTIQTIVCFLCGLSLRGGRTRERAMGTSMRLIVSDDADELGDGTQAAHLV